MRHEQDYNDMNSRDRERYNAYRNRRSENQQDAANRWGEPDPRMRPHDDERRRFEEERDRRENSDYRNDWRPFEQRDNRHFQEEGRRHGYRNDRPEWERGQNFNRQNQHAEDRWSHEREMPHPQQHHHPRHASEKFYREQRRRNW